MKFKNIPNGGNGYTFNHNFRNLYSIYNLMMSQVDNIGKKQNGMKKSPMVSSAIHQKIRFLLRLWLNSWS